MQMLYKKGLITASVSTLLFLGAIPERMSWEDGITIGISQVHAAGQKAGQGGSGGGDDGGHEDGHDDGHDHEETDQEHGSSGGKGKGPAYRGGRIGSSKGRGGPSTTVIEKILESE